MYVVINSKTYDELSSLSFVAEADVTGNTVPADEFYVSIKTDDSITVGRYARLYDDLDNLWAKFWIVGADREDAYHVQVHAMSDVAILDYSTMAAVVYSSEPVANVLNAIFAKTHAGAGGYTLASALSGQTISGYCPEQTARKRLQWVCFVLKAFVRQSFSSKIQIMPVSQTVEKNILSGKIKYKPVTEYGDYVSKITVRAYAYALTPKASIGTTDKWVQVENDYYVVTTQDHSATNPNFPSGLPDNELMIDDVSLVNSSNAAGILNYFKELYFNRISVSLDAIDNAEFLPGEKVIAYTDSEAIVAGYIKACSFSFGLQAMASMQLVAAEDVEGASLTVEYLHNSSESVLRHRYFLPVGYPYELDTQYPDTSDAYHRYVYRPLVDTITGTVASGLNIKIVDCGLAAHLNKSTGVLGIKSVDAVDWASGSSEVVAIG